MQPPPPPPSPPSDTREKEKGWQKWAVALVVGLVMLAEGVLCAWPHGPPPFHQPQLAFGCLLGGGLLVLLALKPLWGERDSRRRGRKGASAGAQPNAASPPLPAPFKEAAAFARRRQQGQGADEVGDGWMSWWVVHACRHSWMDRWIDGWSDRRSNPTNIDRWIDRWIASSPDPNPRQRQRRRRHGRCWPCWMWRPGRGSPTARPGRGCSPAGRTRCGRSTHLGAFTSSWRSCTRGRR